MDLCERFSLIVQRYYMGWEGIMLADTMGCDGVRYDTIKGDMVRARRGNV